MKYVTYENINNPHITIHKNGCNQIAKNGGVGRGKYKNYNKLIDAQNYANTTGLPVKYCSFCNP